MEALNLPNSPDWLQTLIGCSIVLGVAVLVGWLTRIVLLNAVKALTRRTAWNWDYEMYRTGVFGRLANVAPLVVIQHGMPWITGISEEVANFVHTVTSAMIVGFVFAGVAAVFTAIEKLYSESGRGKERGYSIKGYVQLIKILLAIVGTVTALSIILDRSPLTLLAGLGAISAVMLLIFKDTIMSVIASIQLQSNDMLRVGDWIEMPSKNVDGTVEEIALHTVKVKNWDKTISTIPTWELISDSFRNYRTMYQEGRRIRRALHIDANSIRFLTEEERERLRQFKVLRDYLDGKEAEIAQHNDAMEEAGFSPLNYRRLSNLGTFRAYTRALIHSHPGIRQNVFRSIRLLDPGPTGIPLQVYAYTVDTSAAGHSAVRDDIFEHLITILPEFGLKLFQEPAGTDIREGLSGKTVAS